MATVYGTRGDSDSSSEDEFEDALEEQSSSIPCQRQQFEKMDLATSIRDATAALDLFLNNRYNDAKDALKPWVNTSMYHALGYATVHYFQAIMTFEPCDIQEAIHWIKNSSRVASLFRRKSRILHTMLWRNPYEFYTEEEAHAELCYAESVLERAMLTFIQDDNLVSFIKGGLKIRSGYQAYKNAVQLLSNRKWGDASSKMHFESGVRLGRGTFNLMLSILPKRILKVLEFVGFTGSQERGLHELEVGSSLPSLRSPLCTCTLICFHTVTSVVLGTGDGDPEYSERKLGECLEKYPNGVIFLFLAGRTKTISAKIDETTYLYQQAAFMSMCSPQSNELKSRVREIFSQVPIYKQKIAGKSIPLEKFSVLKARKCLQHGWLTSLAGLELIYLWNGFSILSKDRTLLEPILALIEKTVKELRNIKGSYACYADDYSVAMLLKGVIQKALNKPSQAELCFHEVLLKCQPEMTMKVLPFPNSEDHLKYNHYLVPYTLLELGILYLQYNRLHDANTFLYQCRDHNKKYILENRLHFKLHAALETLKAKEEVTRNRQTGRANTSHIPADAL
ncbi:Tetratricopeptide repeat protein 39B [Holothuria leucospilota]|uniref:Tetratricopeptide repeat protein 39B n=1 Tax=Holothuria leucospilota TaxID=206669 RepID=A0A9Q1C9B4_HOLLE|nr:Tetratricopeptide repeat protein 39B [Holothuria leucospilota]